MIDTQRYVNRMGSLRGNMASCCNHAANGASKPGLSRAEIIANKIRKEKAETSLASLRTKLFTAKPFARVAAIKQTGEFNFRVLAGVPAGINNVLAKAEITRGELSSVLRSFGFTGLRIAARVNNGRFAKAGKRVLALS